jgi:ribosomal protein L6P/L9E
VSKHSSRLATSKKPVRTFSSTTAVRSYVGSTPIVIPPGITLERRILSQNVEDNASQTNPSPRRGAQSRTNERLIVKGKHGETTIKVYDYMRFLLSQSGDSTANQSASDEAKEVVFKVKRRNPACPAEATNQPFVFTPSQSLSPAIEGTNSVALFVETPSEKSQRQLWGTTRTLIANAITGQSEGFTLPIYLIGVGYRAQLMQDTSASPPTPTSVSPSEVTPASELPIVQTTMNELFPRRRLALRLGYSHVIYVDVPSDIKVTVPSPTIIILWGRDKQHVGQFAANIRSLRPPEVYKGKVRTWFIEITLYFLTVIL